MTIVGSDIPTGDEVKWYYGGGGETQIGPKSLTEVAGIITLPKIAEFGSVFVIDADGNPTAQMLELETNTPDVAASESSGTSYVRTSAAGTTTVYAYYLDTQTTSLVQIMACKDVSSPLGIDTKDAEVQGQVQSLRKTGAAKRTLSLEAVEYNDAFLAAAFGNLVHDSPAVGMTKWVDNFTAVIKISALVGKQTLHGGITRKWFLMGCQVTKIDHAFPTTDFYAKSMDFLVDYAVSRVSAPYGYGGLSIPLTIPPTFGV